MLLMLKVATFSRSLSEVHLLWWLGLPELVR